MHFTRLRLQGFKSFVDPTELVIAPGLTGVVGPNGCGKSNLLEALRWVMGENRASAMRGGGMEDVIFAGAAARPARNHAEVGLLLDNADRQAPPAFENSETLDIVRRITRDAGSVYKANGKEVRARDVQMLFADASTGAHSPALVRQGQISELINAKPKARRRVLEEAAGISGLYQRRHEAELKLRGTETNLTRVDDVLEALTGQLALLERQARQAAKYRALGAALRQAEGLLLFRHWADADAERLAAVAALTEAVAAAAQAQGAAGRAQAAREAAAAAMPPLREEETVAGAVFQRLKVARDALDQREQRAREDVAGLTARLAQLQRDAEREAGLNRDAEERLAKLDWERTAIAEASEGQDAALAAAERDAADAAASLKTQETAADRAGEDLARLVARHQAAERRRQEAETRLGRLRATVEETDATAARLTEEHDAAAATRATADAALAAARKDQAAADTALTEAEADRVAAQAAEAEARGIRAEAEGEAAGLRSEAAALERVLARSAGEGPEILDDVRAAPGFESALGAALGEDLKAPETEDGTGWRSRTAPVDAPLPGAAPSLADHVTAPVALGARLAQTGVVEQAQGAALQAQLRPGQRLVSRAGDMWRWDGFVRQADDAPSATALHLQQVNRLSALQAAHGEAAARAETAVAAHDVARTALTAAQEAEGACRQTRRGAEASLSEAIRAAGQAETALGTLAGRLETVTAARARQAEELVAAQAEVAAAADIDLADPEEARAGVEALRQRVEDARAAMLAARGAQDALAREIADRAKRAQEITRETGEWRNRLETAETRAGELGARIAETRAALTQAESLPDQIGTERNGLVEQIAAAETRCKAAADALAAGETALRAADTEARATERTAGEAREAKARVEALAEAAGDRAQTAVDRIRAERDTDAEGLLAQLETAADAVASAEDLQTQIDRARRQRDALGAVNLRAEEDAAEIRTERDTLHSEKADLEEAVAKLRQGIGALNREGRQRLLAAFDEVNKNFSTLFRTLFGGGDASLVLVESEDPLEAGLEIMCQPPGKKLSTLSLLSGGEQTLTALSLIFAVFLANPSPICVLDEVDAPLDDANVTRFCDLLDEMINRTDTRFLIITHHAVTMARMDRLFGVTMAELGVSQLVSVDLRQAEDLVDA
ncbi:MAG: chromosome segregation protein SMC [Pseudomonadota bacterium]